LDASVAHHERLFGPEATQFRRRRFYGAEIDHGDFVEAERDVAAVARQGK
jgi:hypothetical protein